MRRFRRALPGLRCVALLCLAHRAFCAAAMRRRAAADIVRFGDALRTPLFSEVRTSIALSIRSRSCWSSLTTASRFDMRGILPPAKNPLNIIHCEHCVALKFTRTKGVGTWSRRHLGIFREQWQKNLGAPVVELKCSFVREIEAAESSSSDWYQPES